MNKEEILNKARKENNGSDIADIEAQKKGAYIGYFAGIAGILAVDGINYIVFKSLNHGPNAVICLMAMVAFFVKFFSLKKKHELFVALCYTGLFILFLVLWFLQLCGVMA